MGDYKLKKHYIHHCFIYDFQKCVTATEPFKNICAIHTDALKARTCQLWYERFKTGDVTYPTKLSLENDPLLMKNFSKRILN